MTGNNGKGVSETKRVTTTFPNDSASSLLGITAWAKSPL